MSEQSGRGPGRPPSPQHAPPASAPENQSPRAQHGAALVGGCDPREGPRGGHGLSILWPGRVAGHCWQGYDSHVLGLQEEPVSGEGAGGPGGPGQGLRQPGQYPLPAGELHRGHDLPQGGERGGEAGCRGSGVAPGHPDVGLAVPGGGAAPRPPRALRLPPQRLAIAKEFGDKAAERRAYSNLGNAHIFLGRFDVAAEYYK